MEHIKQFPHCDQRVLHAPKDGCVYCNQHPEWQELREAWGIAFTGHSDDVVEYRDWEGNIVQKTLIPCPAEWSRSAETIHRWYGNAPRKEDD